MLGFEEFVRKERRGETSDNVRVEKILSGIDKCVNKNIGV